MQVHELKIEPTIRLDECELLLKRVTSGSYPRISLPTRLTGNGALGLEASLIHLIVLWARSSKNPTLMVPESGEDGASYLANLCTSAYGLTAVALAKVAVDINGVVVSSSVVRSLVAKRLREFDDQNFDMFAQEEGTSFLSVYGRQQEQAQWMFSSSLSTASPTMQLPTQISRWLMRYIKQLIPPKFLERFDEERCDALGVMAFELLENAYIHGRLNEYAEPIQVGVQSISIKLVEVPVGYATDAAGGNRDVSLYLLQSSFRKNEKKNLFLEMTIFDSGIGYHRWINATCNLSSATNNYRGKTEEETIRDCVLHHATSKISDGSGIGLFRVTRLLKDMFGFIRIRTGGSCFYSRLDWTIDGKPRVLGGDHEEAKNPDVKLQAWFPGSELSESSGTSITICIPFTDWGKRSGVG